MSPARKSTYSTYPLFQSLTAKGIIALENAGNTQSDGYDDAMQVFREAKDKKKIVGYCFYHGQDLDRAVRGEDPYLAFGPIDPDKEETEGARVGRIVVDELELKGFAVKWGGTFKHRMFVQKVDWKRRIAP